MGYNENMSEFAKVRLELDKILIEQIKRLHDIDEADTLSFNLATISCLLLVVEKENEIRSFPEAQIKRYTKETFLEDLVDIGFEIDDDFMMSFQSLSEKGFVEVDSQNQYQATLYASDIVHFIDHIFPDMSGINLVAYLLQIIEEVVTGRKTLDDAKTYLEQTLSTHAIAYSDQKSKQKKKDSISSSVDTTQKAWKYEPKSKNTEELRRTYTQRLAQLRKIAAEKILKPSIITQDGYKNKLVKVRDVFPKFSEMDDVFEKTEQSSIQALDSIEPPMKAEPEEEVSKVESQPDKVKSSKQEIESQRPEPKIDHKDENDVDLPDVDLPIDHLDEKAFEQQPSASIDAQMKEEQQQKPPIEDNKKTQEKPLEAQPVHQSQPEPVQAQPVAKTPEPPLSADNQAPQNQDSTHAVIEENIPPVQTNKKQESIVAQENIQETIIEHDDHLKPESSQEAIKKPAIISEDFIAKQIAEFQEELSITCPLCNKGKIKENSTDRGKNYYSCSNAECRFISWAKPYHFPCPICNNLYLVEFNKDGIQGLECPRSTCSYSQNNLLEPAKNIASDNSADASKKPTKKRKLIRRVRKKR